MAAWHAEQHLSRPPRSSDGCVVLTNEDLQKLGKALQIGLTRSSSPTDGLERRPG